ncbi:MAG TPA: TfoX/Sxy family protein [Solirubrobacteraceae bacterium]|jgi:TfoX/Sxy family transcriptional regulator of competence genes|nr:TfoX/Sxy family protein [Solirubrobacteraceae bacterium]
MAYDEDVANRVRELVALEDGLDERRMFGGLAFLIDGNLALAVSQRDALLVRVGPDGAADALSRPHTEQAVMGGRVMRGWVYVSFEGVRTKRELAPWARRAIAFARSLPPKD